MPCLTERNIKIGGAALVDAIASNRLGLELTRDPPTGDPLPLPTERQWKDGMRWQRR